MIGADEIDKACEHDDSVRPAADKNTAIGRDQKRKWCQTDKEDHKDSSKHFAVDNLHCINAACIGQ